jgi:hypothetical protein
MYDVAIQMLIFFFKFKDLKANELINKNSQTKETFEVFQKRLFSLYKLDNITFFETIIVGDKNDYDKLRRTDKLFSQIMSG